MARGDGKKAQGRNKPTSKGQGRKAGGTAIVNKYQFFAKAKLAAYPTERPSGTPTCLYLDKGHNTETFLEPRTIVAGRSGKNEELCCRIGMGLALDAASAHHGTQVLQSHFGSVLPKKLHQQLRKTGLPVVLEELAADKGKEFLACVSVLNVGKTGKPKEKDVKAAVQTFVDYLQQENAEFYKGLQCLAKDAAGLYLFAMTLLKDIALLQNPREWAAKVGGAQGAEVKSWKRRPEDPEKLKKMLVAELMAKVEKNEAGASKSSSSSKAASSNNPNSSGSASAASSPR